jgi:hypothetical protein
VSAALNLLHFAKTKLLVFYLLAGLQVACLGDGFVAG